MTIYCIGDSHTEGTGLADRDLFPNDYPGDANIANIPRVEWTNKRSDLIKKDPFLFEKVRQENLKRAWPAYLSKITNRDVTNGGFGGASIISMSMSIMHDLEKIKKPSEVIVGLTSFERIPILNKNPIHGYHALAFKNVMPSYVGNVDRSYQQYCTSYWTSHSDEEMLTFYLYHCLSIKNYVRLKINKDPIFVKTTITDEWSSIVKQSNIYLLKEYWDLLSFEKLDSQRGLNTFAEPANIVLADGHYKENAHAAFADYIAREFLDDR